MTYPRQEPCPCGVQSSAVCAYANTVRVCHGRPDMRITDKGEWEALVAYFKDRRKR